MHSSTLIVNYAIIKAYGYVRRITFKRFAQIHLRVLRYLSAFVHRQLSKGRVCSNEDFVRKLCAEAEAGGEAVEAVGVEKIGGDRKVLLEVRPLFLGERSVQLGLKVALFLRKLLHSAARADGALARR